MHNLGSILVSSWDALGITWLAYGEYLSISEVLGYFIQLLLCWFFINTQCMCCRVTVVVCVCLSVTKLAATYWYLVCESKVQCYKVPYGIPNV